MPPPVLEALARSKVGAIDVDCETSGISIASRFVRTAAGPQSPRALDSADKVGISQGTAFPVGVAGSRSQSQLSLNASAAR